MPYCLERRDPEFDAKMVQVLHVYRPVENWGEKGAPPPDLVVVLPYDEKPGIQAILNAATDLPPVSGKHSAVGRAMNTSGTEPCRCWPVSTCSGAVLGLVRERHRRVECIEFLRLADAHPACAHIPVVLDNHSAHISRETRTFLGTLPNRFEFTFTSQYGSWLNLIE